MAHFPLFLSSILLVMSLLFIFGNPVFSQLYHTSSCFTDQDKYTNNSVYHQNLKMLLNNLTFTASERNAGFYSNSFGLNEDTVYGLYLCRGDVLPETCSFCIGKATELVIGNCPGEREAIMWHPECILRYANRNILSIEEETPTTEPGRVYFSPPPNKTLSHPSPPPPAAQPFNISEVLIDLINQTAFGDYSATGSTRFFVPRADNATGSLSNLVLYSFAQCTPDLTPILCHKCLTQAFKIMSSSVLSISPIAEYLPSCQIRFDTHNFFAKKIKLSTAQSPPLSSALIPDRKDPTSESNENKKGSPNIPIAIGVASGVALLLLFGFFFIMWRKSYRKPPLKGTADEIITTESLEYDISAILAATNNFSAENKLGQGQYGAVYMGRLEDGQVVAVKRLSSNMKQETSEFKNEMVLIAKLQHKNLARLLGFCATEEEKLLIYEYLTNGSLDQVLFDPEKGTSLAWKNRYKIIEGIAKGLLYLHEYSQSKIIHHNLKPSNILLDKDLTPKISDFGMEKLVAENQVQGNHNGTSVMNGYLAPEYIRSRELSVKSDIYSFGVIALEIVSGQRVTDSVIHNTQQEEGLLQRAWMFWNSKEPLAFIDPTVRGSFSAEEVTRCIHIGLSCVQEEPEKRPTINSIVSLLSNHSSNISDPETATGYPSSSSSPFMYQSYKTYSGTEDITVLSAR